MKQRDDDQVVGSSSGFGSLGSDGCLSTDDVLAHLDRRMQGARLQSVHDHLDACVACRVVMAEAARIATNGDRAQRQPRTLADGEVAADRYQVRRFIARGGMGEVYEAVDSALGEVVALKTLAVTATDRADAVKRLLAEVRIARKVTHPNVCRILEFGTHQRAGSVDPPVPFLTMPLLRGETLARRIERNGRLPPRQALQILTELAAGLAAVHEVGVVHRDFKSDNVFLVKGDDGGERAVVMDFGLARALEAHGDGHGTTGRVLLGTPAYMAPEQVEGKLLTKAVDVYAFGVVAFELLTGRVPFVGESAAAVALARLQRGAAPPSSMVPGLDKEWDAIIQRCLRRGSEQRYRGMAEVRGALDRLRDGAGRRSWRPALAVTLAAAMAAAAVATSTVLRNPRANAAGGTAAAAPPAAGEVATSPQIHVPPASPRSPAVSLGEPTGVPAEAAPEAIKRQRAIGRGRRGRAPSPHPTPEASSPSSSAESPRSAPTPFDRPAASRSRQPDDLVDPF